MIISQQVSDFGSKNTSNQPRNGISFKKYTAKNGENCIVWMEVKAKKHDGRKFSAN